jgi:hypothetical protein
MNGGHRRTDIGRSECDYPDSDWSGTKDNKLLSRKHRWALTPISMISDIGLSLI